MVVTWKNTYASPVSATNVLTMDFKLNLYNMIDLNTGSAGACVANAVPSTST